MTITPCPQSATRIHLFPRAAASHPRSPQKVVHHVRLVARPDRRAVARAVAAVEGLRLALRTHRRGSPLRPTTAPPSHRRKQQRRSLDPVPSPRASPSVGARLPGARLRRPAYAATRNRPSPLMTRHSLEARRCSVTFANATRTSVSVARRGLTVAMTLSTKWMPQAFLATVRPLPAGLHCKW